MPVTLAALRKLATERNIDHIGVSRAQLIALLRPPDSDTSLDARFLRDQLGLVPTSPDKRSPGVHRLLPRAPPPCVRVSVHQKRRAADDGPDDDGKATQVRRLIEITWQLS